MGHNTQQAQPQGGPGRQGGQQDAQGQTRQGGRNNVHQGQDGGQLQEGNQRGQQQMGTAGNDEEE